MPEGHLLHRYARQHQDALAGEPLAVSSPQGKFPDAARLDGQVLERAEAYGKNLFHHWSDRSIVHVHLGQGGLFLHAAPPAPSRPQSRLRLAGTRLVADLIAPSICARIDAAARASIVAKLGPDPLRDDADPQLAIDRMTSRAAPIGALLLDQSVLSGVGNVLRAEALFLCGISPRRAGASLSRAEARALYATLERLLRQAALDGRILVTVPDGSDRTTISEHETRFVYKQEHCRRCGAPITVATIGGRTSYTCPRCQPT